MTTRAITPTCWARELGPAWPHLGWTPAPRYLLRRDLVLRILQDLPHGDLLEVGCGIGALLHEFSNLGFQCTGLESSKDAYDLARKASETMPAASINIFTKEQPGWSDRFKVLLALEVLEHIEDDESALHTWRNWLEADGTIVISVPAHARRWGPADEWAGHVRRYEGSDLRQKLEHCGFHVTRFECYGFPAGNILEKIRHRLYQPRVILDEHGQPDRAANNARSGIDRSDNKHVYPLLASKPGRIALRSLYAIQKKFLSSDLGVGYLVSAKKA